MVTISRLVTTFFLFPFYTHTYKYIYSYNVRKMLDKYLSTDIHHRPRAHPGEHARNENFFPNLKGLNISRWAKLNIRIERSRNRDQQKTKEGGGGEKKKLFTINYHASRGHCVSRGNANSHRQRTNEIIQQRGQSRIETKQLRRWNIIPLPDAVPPSDRIEGRRERERKIEREREGGSLNSA